MPYQTAAFPLLRSLFVSCWILALDDFQVSNIRVRPVAFGEQASRRVAAWSINEMDGPKIQNYFLIQTFYIP